MTTNNDNTNPVAAPMAPVPVGTSSMPVNDPANTTVVPPVVPVEVQSTTTVVEPSASEPPVETVTTQMPTDNLSASDATVTTEVTSTAVTEEPGEPGVGGSTPTGTSGM